MVVLMSAFPVLFLSFALAVPAQTASDANPARTISIVAERFTFNPSRINLKQGEVVEFILTSDDTDHGFRIPEAGIDVAIPPRSKGELRVKFVAVKKGRFAFECSRPCGAGHNLMRGVIAVK